MTADAKQPKLLKLTIEERILVHLLSYPEEDFSMPAPFDVCQEGIAAAVEVKRSQISRALGSLKEKDLVVEKLANIVDHARRRKVYFLTIPGIQKAKEIQLFINETLIVLKDARGNRKVIPISDIQHYCNASVSMNEIISELGDGMEFDCSKVSLPTEGGPDKSRKRRLFTTPDLIGRKDELTYLEEELGKVKKGKGKGILVCGEAGIGKTRLMDELEMKALDRGYKVMKGECLYQKETDPYLPFTEAFKKDLDKSMFQKLFPSPSEEVSDSHIQYLRDRMLEFFSDLLDNLVKEKPVLIVIEDIHWSDRASLHMLHFLARTSRKKKVMICATFRPEDLVEKKGIEHPLAIMLQRVSREKLFQIINLERLDHNETAEMINSIFEAEDVPEPLVDLVHAESEGNPLFIEEVVKTLKEQGAILRTDEKWRLEEVEVDNIPKTIRDIIDARIGLLEKDARKIVQYASVAGPYFNLDILMDAIKWDNDEDFLDKLDKMIDARLIEEDTTSPELVYRFTHAKIQEVVYSEMTTAKVQMVHGKIGRSLEKRYEGNLDPVIYDLVRHFYHSKDKKKALDYAIKAGDKARNMYALDESEVYYEQALEVLDKMNETQALLLTKVEVLNKVAYIYFLKTEWGKALDKAWESVRINEKLKAPIRMAESLRTIGEIHTKQVEIEKAMEVYGQALSISEKHDDAHGISDTYLGMASVYMKKGKYDEVTDYLEKALMYAEKAEDKTVLEKIYNEFGILLREKGDLDQAIEYYIKSLKLGSKSGNLYNMAKAYNNLGTAYYDTEEWSKAIEYFERCINTSRDIGYTRGIMYGLNNAAQAYSQIGEMERAIKMCEEALLLSEKLNEEIMVGGVYSTYGNIYKEMKDWKQAAKYFQKGMEVFERLGVPYYLASTYYEMGVMYKEMGELEKSRTSLEAALQHFKKLGVQHFIDDINEHLKEIG